MPTTVLKNPVNVNVTSTAVSLVVAGTAAVATTGSGAQPSNTLTVEGTTGQETTGAGQTAGAGANVSITAGTGGAAPSGSTKGAGGSVTIDPGAPGAGLGAAAGFGNVLLATEGGNVGIGTTAPASESGSENLLQIVAPSSFGQVSIATARANVSGDNIGKVSFDVLANAATYRSRAAIVAQSSGSTTNKYGAALLFATAADNASDASTRMAIDRNGNVGVGTTSPGRPLEIRHASNPQLRLSADAANFVDLRANSIGRLVVTTGAGSVTTFASSSGSNNFLTTGANSAAVVNAANNSGASFILQNTDNTNGNYTWFGAHNSSASNVVGFAFVADGAGSVNPAGHLEIFTRAAGTSIAEVVRVTGDGKFGIGTPAPGSKLHVNGGVQVGTPTGGDKGAGSINVSGDIYRNGTPLLEKLEEAYQQIIELTKRVDGLEATLARSSGKEKS